MRLTHTPTLLVSTTGDGRELAVDGDSRGSQFGFHCKGDFGGKPEGCAGKDVNGNVLGKGEGKSGATLIGVSIGIYGYCVAGFDSDGPGCPVEMAGTQGAPPRFGKDGLAVSDLGLASSQDYDALEDVRRMDSGTRIGSPDPKFGHGAQVRTDGCRQSHAMNSSI